MVAAGRGLLEPAQSSVCEAEEQSQQRGGRCHWMRPRLGCRESLGQEQDYANGLDEAPIGDNPDAQAEAQQDWDRGRTNEVVELILLAVDRTSDLQVKEPIWRWKAGWAVAEASPVGTSSMPASAQHHEVQCCFDARTDAVEHLDLVGTELGRYRQGFGRTPKRGVKRLVSNSGSEQEMAAELPVTVPGPQTVRGLEHALPAYAPLASAPPSERHGNLRRSVLVPELDMMVGCWFDPYEVTVAVSFLCQMCKAQLELG